MLSECVLAGPLLTPGFVARELPSLLTQHDLWPADACWPAVRRALHGFAGSGGPERVLHRIVSPLADALGRAQPAPREPVTTRLGPEDGGYALAAPAGDSLRIWAAGSDTPLDTPPRRAGLTLPRLAARVLRVAGESAGFVTNGLELRLLLCDPAGADSSIGVPLGGQFGWAAHEDSPDSFRVVAALAGPRGIASLPEIFDAARLHQTSVTRTLRQQSRAAIEDFSQAVLDRPENPPIAPSVLWRQALTIVYRLLFVLKLESAAEPGRGFGFATSDPWRRSLSPNRALGPLVRRHLDHGADTGRMLEDGLRILFRICREGLTHGGLSIAPLAGGLFDPSATAALDSLRWGERASALLLDRLLWTTPGGRERERVHYGSLDVEELGRVYESLLDLEPAIAAVPMTRARRGRLETVVPAKSTDETTIAAGRFYTRTGLGRRAGGSYYTPHGFVRHLVRETLTPLVEGPVARADPAAILDIKVIDPAMGSGHFLVESCRFLAGALYEACSRRDAMGTEASRARIDSLPDLDDRLSAWLPSRSPDKSDAGPSRARALAICRRLVSVRCLYGIDQDPLAVELAKLSLWLESFAEGLPLTFLDHRLIAGDSIGGPFVRDLTRLPVGGGDLDPLLARGVAERIQAQAGWAMAEVRLLESSIGATVADTIAKQDAAARLDRLLSPLRELARAWSGAVRSGAREANDAWLGLAGSVAETGTLPSVPHAHQTSLLALGASAVPLDLMFPEAFQARGGFDAVLGNPPWDVIHYQTKEFLASFDPAVMDAPTKRERETIERGLLADPAVGRAFDAYKQAFVERKRLCERMFSGMGPTGSVDLFQVFTERMLDCAAEGAAVGLVVPSSIHANEGTAHLRRRLLREATLESCFTFDNRRKWFDIHGRQKFSLLVARRGGSTSSFRCGFYLDSLSDLRDPERIMRYDRSFVAATGGASETFLELRGGADQRLARHLFVGRPDMGSWMEQRGIVFGREAHMTDDSHRFSPIAQVAPDEGFPLHEGKTFHQFTDRWLTPPRYAIRFDAMADKPAWHRAAAHYRLAYREIARATDERTAIAAVIPPAHVFGHKATCERTPWTRPDSTALVLGAIFNSFAFDWCVRQKTAASVSLFMVHACPAPSLTKTAARFLAHGALRLSCAHEAYDPLWRAQLGWAAKVETARARVRAELDAVVARAYGLSRDDYRHVLSGFPHKSDPDAPDRCLDAFDRLSARDFYTRNDPFARVALNIDPSYAAW